MFRLALIVFATGCVADDPHTELRELDATLAFTRAHVVDDIYHYELVIPIGDAPNAALRLHRVVREAAPFVPRHTRGAAMLLHGDFSTFVTNFVPVLGDPASPVAGLAPYLAARDLDVWGLDRRWTLPGAADDISDFGEMGVAQELEDLQHALAFARAIRGSGDQLALVGFSHGGQLAYTYAAVEGARPAAERHVDAIVPMDWYGAFTPEDEPVRLLTCEISALEYEAVAGGEVDVPNDTLIAIGELARTAPDATSPIFGRFTNRGALLRLAGQTYLLAPFAPLYHWTAPILEGNSVVMLRESPEAAIAAWLEGATHHQALLETADLDALLCGEGALPVDAPLSRIAVPLLYLGAAGGVGANGVHATTLVSSTDVTTVMVQRFGPDRRAEDFGHADLLFATDAPALAWQPLASWLLHH